MGTTTLVSVGHAGDMANDLSSVPKISNDGRYIVFESFATNLVPGESDIHSDIYVRDMIANTTTRVTIGHAGGDSDGESQGAAISGNGRYVAFESSASNLIENFNGPENTSQVYLHDLQTNQTELISKNISGDPGNSVSGSISLSFDGQYVGYVSNASDLVANDDDEVSNVFFLDRATGLTTRKNFVSLNAPSISADGRYFTVTYSLTPFVPGEPLPLFHVFIHDNLTESTVMISANEFGEPGDGQSGTPSISDDGRYVAFVSRANNLAPQQTNNTDYGVFVRDIVAGLTWRASDSATGYEPRGASAPVISADAQYVAFESSSFGLIPTAHIGSDVFIRTTLNPDVSLVTPSMLQIGSTTSVTITGSGFTQNAFPVLNADVKNVVFVDANTITADITVRGGSAPGAENITMTIAGSAAGPLSGAAALCADCVTFF